MRISSNFRPELSSKKDFKNKKDFSNTSFDLQFGSVNNSFLPMHYFNGDCVYFDTKNNKKSYKSIAFSGTLDSSIGLNSANLGDDIGLCNRIFINDDNDNLALEDYRNELLKKINEKECFAENSKLIENIIAMIQYSKTKEQLRLCAFVLNNDFFHNEKKMSQMRGIILAANTKEKSEFVKKVFSNEIFYKNNNFLSKLEPILYSFNSLKVSYEPKFALLDKIADSPVLCKNDSFMDCAGKILYHVYDDKSSQKMIRVIDSVLANNELRNNQRFISALGRLFSMPDVSRHTNMDLPKVLDSLDADSKPFYIMKAIASILGSEGTTVFAELISNETIYNDDKFISFLPDIISSINKKNYNKVDEVIYYIKRNSNKNTEEFNKEIIREYMQDAYLPSELNKTEQFLKVKAKAYEKKEQLNTAVSVVTDAKIEEFFDENKKNILSAIELLGMKNFVHAFSLKLFGLKDLCNDCALIKERANKNDYQLLLLKINPHASELYIDSQNKVLDLKKKYSNILKVHNTSDTKELLNQINDYTRKLRILLENKLNYDPDTVINRVRVIANIPDIDLDDKNLSKSRLHNFIDLLQNTSPENDELWQKSILKEVFHKLDIAYDKHFADRLDIVNNKYLGKILLANDKFLNDLKNLFLLIKKCPDKKVSEILNDIENNKITKKLFENFGIDYEKWVDYDENSCFVLPQNKNIVVKKVNMNDINKALFLGNEVGCCTSVGSGIFQESAIAYLQHKFIGAIEVLDSDIPIGNTMCYFAKVDDKLSLVLDNIELLKQYSNNTYITDGIIMYAKKICEEVNKPNIPVYVSGHRNKVDLSEYYTNDCLLNVIGDSEQNIYLDGITNGDKIKPSIKYLMELTRVD